jgi:phosphoribosyl-ATP pyrophosphohydrolase/phosphoribosyl-AMP cyclohydrolase
MTQLIRPRTEPLWGPNGLAPVIVQDVADGRVLMLAWMDEEAWRVTRDTGVVHFHSRTRDRLWRKGESSGHELRVREIVLDCDADAILVLADPVGPTCHRNTRSCFDPDEAVDQAAHAPSIVAGPGVDKRGLDDASPAAVAGGEGFAWLEGLWETIASRAAERPEDSYTTRLLDGGVDAVGRKVTEEATEVLIAAKDDATAEAGGTDRDATAHALAGETADLLYHALVLLAERNVRPAEVIEVLRARDAG